MATSQALLEFASNDLVPVIRKQSVVLGDGTTRHLQVPVEITLDELRQRIMTDPAGMKEVRIDQTFNLASLGATYVNITTIPAGSKVRLAVIQILTTVTFASSGTSLGIGTNAATPTLLLAGAATLTANYQKANMPADAAGIIATSTAIDLCGVIQSSGLISAGNITAGSVRVLLVYNTPAVLPNV